MSVSFGSRLGQVHNRQPRAESEIEAEMEAG